MSLADEIDIRMDEGEMGVALLRECGEDRAADLLAARLGGLRDALAVMRAAPDADAPQDEADIGGVWTPRRNEILAKLWAECESAAYILECVNALPGGAPVANAEAVYKRANRQGLPARIDLRGTRPINPMAGVLSEDLQEARDMLAAGSISAKGLGEYFGWEIRKAQAIADALRAEIKAAAA